MIAGALRCSTALLVIAIVMVAGAGIAGTPVSKMVDQLDPKWERLFRLIEQQKKAPDSALFSKDKGTYQKKIDNLLDEAIAILGDSPSVTTITEIRFRQRYIEQRKEIIASLKAKKAMNPDKDYTKEIEKEEQRIATSRQEIERLKSGLVNQLDSVGIKLSQEQADSLANSVTGEDDARMFTVFYNIRLFTGQLKTLAGETGENLAIAKKYYGMHTVLLMTLLHLHDIYISRVDQSYLPKIKGILDENRKLQSETKSLMKGSEGTHKASLTANLEAQQLTGKVAAMYLSYLDKKKNKVAESRKKVNKEWEVAVNTFKTVTVAHILINIIRESEAFYKSLTELQVPDLLTFTNAEMKNEFQRLTIQMKQ
jgi:hypothetical protein